MSELTAKDIRCKVGNDYTINDIESYNQSITTKKVPPQELEIYKKLAEKYNLKDSDGDYNWVKVMKAIEFHNQVIATILNTKGWFLPIHTPMGTFDIRIDKILFTIKSLSGGNRSKKTLETLNEFIDWYNNYYVYRQRNIRLKKNFQKYHYYLYCVDTSEAENNIPTKTKRTTQQTILGYIGSDCWYNKRKGKIIDIIKKIPYICVVQFEDNGEIANFGGKEIVIQAKIDKMKEKLQREALRAETRIAARNAHINKVYDNL